MSISISRILNETILDVSIDVLLMFLAVPLSLLAIRETLESNVSVLKLRESRRETEVRPLFGVADLSLAVGTDDPVRCDLIEYPSSDCAIEWRGKKRMPQNGI